MSSTNTPGVTWVVGEATGKDNNGGTASVPTPFYQATNTTAPTGSPVHGNVHITSASGVYLYNGAAWIGPFVPA